MSDKLVSRCFMAALQKNEPTPLYFCFFSAVGGLIGIRWIPNPFFLRWARPILSLKTPEDVAHMRVVGIYRSARGREGSPNGGDRTLAFWLPGATDPRQRRWWEQAAAAAGVRERLLSPSGAVFFFLIREGGEEKKKKILPPDARARSARVCLVIDGCARAHDFSVISQKSASSGGWFRWGFVFNAASVPCDGSARPVRVEPSRVFWSLLLWLEPPLLAAGS